MKKLSLRGIASAFAFAAILAPLAFAGSDEKPPAPPATPAGRTFDQLKALAGNWETKDDQGRPVSATYRVVSNGSAVMEEISYGNMITVYHLDGDRLMMTHFCAGQNQPRMKTAPIKAASNKVKFDFVDITNLAKPDDAYMSDLEVTIKDSDHFTAVWMHNLGGKKEPMTFEWARKKS